MREKIARPKKSSTLHLGKVVNVFTQRCPHMLNNIGAPYTDPSDLRHRMALLAQVLLSWPLNKCFSKYILGISGFAWKRIRGSSISRLAGIGKLPWTTVCPQLLCFPSNEQIKDNMAVLHGVFSFHRPGRCFMVIKNMCQNLQQCVIEQSAWAGFSGDGKVKN